MKRILWSILMIIFSVFSLSSCGESETQQILTDISSYQSTFEIALYDGGNIVRTYFPGTIDLEKRKELVEKLSTAGAETILPKNIKAPFYEVMLCKEDGNSYALKWASGYVVTEGGKVYKKKWKARKDLVCECVEMVDIGVYNSCRHFCKYCYANYDEKIVNDNYNRHNPNSSLLIGELEKDDIIKIRK